MAIQTFGSKLVSEEVSMEFDMLSRLKVGESVVTAIVTSSTYSGEDGSPSLMIDGEPTISNNVVTQRVKGGTAGCIYVISCSIRTSNNNVLINEAKLAVLTTQAVMPPVS